jgi:two-component sensor histidine kinase
VRSFKQVAVDQSSDDIRSFNLRKYLDEVLLSLQPKLKGKPVKIEIDCAQNIELASFPGAVSQIVTNMVVNSLVHGFEEGQPGKIKITGKVDGDFVEFDYSDDGIGMDTATLGQLFDPFFTTKRGSGGSGLGAHILFNLVTGALGGTVKVVSAPGMGLHYKLRFPKIRRKYSHAVPHRRDRPGHRALVDHAVHRRVAHLVHQPVHRGRALRDRIPEQHVDDGAVLLLGHGARAEARLARQPHIELGVGGDEFLAVAAVQLEGGDFDGECHVAFLGESRDAVSYVIGRRRR